ncbi:MAG: hypothetical protein BWY52_00704 [Chloroflexi bacterium ADurb.Bin325]|nr:MAG: hypothetical protein BWY52_00704 [Chloroflexi bacterium ADurb.Bin325]
MAVLLAVVAGVSCVYLRAEEPAAIWTPAPIARASSTATAQPAATEYILPTIAAQPTATARPTSTPSATATRPAAVTPTATQDPKLIVITEADVMRAVGSSGGGDFSARELRIRFTDGRMRIEAAALSYGPVNVQNLVLVGRLVAENGKLRLQTESVSPRGLLTALIPTVANQALEQYTADWYIKEVETLDGRIEVRIR